MSSNGNASVLHIPQSCSITGTSPSDCLVSCLGHSLGRGSYASAELQSAYSTAPPHSAEWRKTNKIERNETKLRNKTIEEWKCLLFVSQKPNLDLFFLCSLNERDIVLDLAWEQYSYVPILLSVKYAFSHFVRIPHTACSKNNMSICYMPDL